MMIGWLLSFIDLLFQILIFAIVARALLSWFNLGPSHPIVRVLYDVTEPILAPLRRVIPTIGMIDITPIVAIVLLDIIRRLIELAVVRALA
ncbi:MAG TPA: YggT family protein [Chloroflexota bacterium]|jgi:YggT family protein|nr:YggT family protein [Chloroflexota bacterium]HZU04444.1 YggT family protein [Chloroflexota bacterium]